MMKTRTAVVCLLGMTCCVYTSAVTRLKRETLRVRAIEEGRGGFFNNECHQKTNVHCHSVSAVQFPKLIGILTLMCLHCAQCSSHGLIQAEPGGLSQLMFAGWISSAAEGC